MRQVAIVAKGGTSALGPWRDPDWEVWGMPWIKYPRADRLFDLHTQAFWDEPQNRQFEAMWRGKVGEHYPDTPIYTTYCRMGALPNTVEFPVDDVIESLPIPYLENSIAYMMALAIHEGAERIGLFGVHMRGAPEYADERASITYLTGLAQGRGIEVSIPPGSPLFMSIWEEGRYGVSISRRMINPLMGIPVYPRLDDETIRKTG